MNPVLGHIFIPSGGAAGNARESRVHIGEPTWKIVARDVSICLCM